MSHKPIKALTVRQPWAWAIALAGKDVENRSWRTGYRGPLAIHAGLGLDSPGDLPSAALATFNRSGYVLPAGAVVAVAELAGCHMAAKAPGCGELLCSDWAVAGQWHWRLAHVRPLAEPVRCRGRLGLWQLAPEAAELVAAQQRGSRA